MTIRRKWFVAAAAGTLFCAGVAIGAAGFNKPKSIIHVVEVRWKKDATEAQKQAALAGVEKMAAEIPGIRNLWLKQTRKQLWCQDQGYDAAFVIEFQDRAAERAYEKHPARLKWFNELYNPIRDQSRSNQYTNE